MVEYIPRRTAVKYVYFVYAVVNVSHCFLDLHAEPLMHSSGVIWTALNIDYPGHSFSHLGVFHGS